MSTFTQYLTESAKSYDFKIKIAGEPKDIDKNRLETALQKFEVTKMSAGKSTPIQSLPLDYDERDEADEELRNDYWKDAQWIGTTNIPYYTDLV